MKKTPQITVYGTAWCGGSRRVRLLLDKNNIAYRWVDIDQDQEAATLLESLNNGYRSVPTIVWPDGTKLVEPSDVALFEKLGILKPG